MLLQSTELSVASVRSCIWRAFCWMCVLLKSFTLDKINVAGKNLASLNYQLSCICAVVPLKSLLLGCVYYSGVTFDKINVAWRNVALNYQSHLWSRAFEEQKITFFQQQRTFIVSPLTQTFVHLTLAIEKSCCVANYEFSCICAFVHFKIRKFNFVTIF